MSKNCIVHYPSIKIPDPTKLVTVDQGRYDKLVIAKNARVKLGGAYFQAHESQCKKVPNQFVESCSLYNHKECYKQFTRATSDLKKNEESASSGNEASSSNLSTVCSNPDFSLLRVCYTIPLFLYSFLPLLYGMTGL